MRWQGVRNLNVAVLAPDGTVVAGGAGQRGAVYLPKGGNFHLEIDYDAPPQMPPSGEQQPQTQQTPYSPVTRDNYGDTHAPSTPGGVPPSIYNNPAYQAMMNRPYTVEVLPASAPVASDGFGRMPFFKLPTGTPGAASSAPGSAVTPASVSTSAPAVTTAVASTPATPSAPAVNLTQDQARAVVLIKGDIGEGTGFLVKTKDGPVVITNQHVIANNPNIKITTSGGLTITPLSFKAATDRDLAMIAIKDEGYSYLTLATDVTAVSPGDPAVTPGNSEGGEVMLNTNGKVLAIGPDRIEIDNPFYHGNSGGPVYDAKTNQVIGVVTEAIKVDTSDVLDKASFASRSSAIQNSMRYFAMRVDNVPKWEDIDLKAYEGETAFLDKFDQRNRCLDSFLNSPSPSDNSSQNGNGQQADSQQDSQDANLWRQDTVLVRANESFEDQSGGDVDTGQKMDALRELLGSIVDAANTDVSTIQNQNNFYMYDRQRAKDEMEYRQALKDELDRISNNISRLGGLPRHN